MIGDNLNGKNLIAGQWSGAGAETLQSINPANGEKANTQFAAGTSKELQVACESADKAFHSEDLRNLQRRSELLENIASEIESLGEELIEAACFETGLPEARILGEKGRTIFQIRQFAHLMKSGDFLGISVDKAMPDRSPIPKPEIKRINVALGPIAVFSASNFPLAFSTAGGDTASALAAGCPVVVKGHESHLMTNEIIGSAIARAIDRTGFHSGTFSFINGGYSIGKELVMNSLIKGVAFTGSFNGGKALMDYAALRSEPIPVFCEMGSINPIIISKGAQSEVKDLATTLADSVFLGTGQFCTNPGLLLVEKAEDPSNFLEGVESSLSSKHATPMLSEKIFDGFSKQVSELTGKAPETKNHSSGFFKAISAAEFLENQIYSEEVFGPFTLAVIYENHNELSDLIRSLKGQLTGSLFIQEDEFDKYQPLVRLFGEKVGRLIFRGVPTGVEVCPSMQHGGPWPSSSDSRFTSVGFDAIQRFLRPLAFQNMPDAFMPSELQSGAINSFPHRLDGKPTS